jgi:hypothetical protein
MPGSAAGTPRLVEALRAYYLPDVVMDAGGATRKVTLQELCAQFPAPIVDKYYSLRGMLQRESIRFDAGVLAATRSLWRTYTACLGERMTREGYVLVFGHVQRAVRDLAQQRDLSYDASDKAAREAVLREDWAKDAEGGAGMDFAHFAWALFQVADLWTDEVAAPAYADFLRRLVAQLTRERGGEREFAFIWHHVRPYGADGAGSGTLSRAAERHEAATRQEQIANALDALGAVRSRLK